MSFSVTILGSSSALPTSQRFPTAQVLNISEQFYLIDCGEGTQIQLRKFKIRINKINHIFISHLHGDHFFGLFGLISTFNMLDRKNDLHIYGPPELEQVLSWQTDFFDYLFYKIIFHKLDCSHHRIIYETDKITVETIPLKHRIPTCGFLFKEKPKPRNIIKSAIEKYNLSIKEIVNIKNGADHILQNGDVIPNRELTLLPPQSKSFAYCSDTLYKEDIIPIIHGVDLLYHEATYTHDMEHRAKETFHSTARQAATLALNAHVKQLLLGHFSARYKKIDEVVNEAISVFPNTLAAEDGVCYKIGF
ncbi:MAG: ribonuclease Z [Bacteroidia bacterium]|nr:ribonuclease Z [Bacteroidia bacterium]